MKYYYYDLAVFDGGTLSEYKDFNDFKNGLLWNRSVAKDYGDTVISYKELIDLLKPNKEFVVELNGAAFISCNDINTFENGFYAD